MGRNARRRAAEHDAERPHGAPPPDQEKTDKPARCPMCGSTNLFIGRTHPYQRYIDVICGHCNWQGELPSNYA